MEFTAQYILFVIKILIVTDVKEYRVQISENK